MPITLNIDLTSRRRQQEALAQLEKQRQAQRETVNSLLAQEIPTATMGGGLQFGPEPVISPQQAEAMLSLRPEQAGIAALKALEQKRNSDIAKSQQATLQETVSGLPLDTPESKALADLFVATGGQNRDIAKALGQQFAPFSLGKDSVRFTGTGEKIVSGADSGDISQDPVQASAIMPDGTVQIVRRSGAVEVTTPSQANIEKIKSARRFGAELQGLRAGERGAAKNAQTQALKAFEGVAGAREKIKLFDEAIDLLRNGAGTGSVERIFPSFKAASVALDNVQGRLGLNVIQNTTFGALSEAELKFALSTALPTGLNEPQLAEWIKQKRDATDKLADYLTNAAIFLSKPGNSIGDFLRTQKTRQFTQGIGITPATPLPIPGGSPPPPGFVENR